MYIENEADDYTPLPEPWCKQAEVEIRETRENAIRSIRQLRRLIQDDGGFHCPTDGPYLLRFLRVAKFDSNKAFKKMKNFLLIRTSYPQFFYKTRIDEVLEIVKLNWGTILSDRAEDGSVIFIFRAEYWKTSISTLEEIANAALLILELVCKEPILQALGIKFIIDAKNVTFGHVREFTPRVSYRLARMFQECLPLRLREIHFLNEALIFNMIYTVVNPFLSKIIRDRIMFHGKSLASLHKYIPASILPAEYGGKKGNFDYMAGVTRVSKYEGQIPGGNKVYYSKDEHS